MRVCKHVLTSACGLNRVPQADLLDNPIAFRAQRNDLQRAETVRVCVLRRRVQRVSISVDAAGQAYPITLKIPPQRPRIRPMPVVEVPRLRIEHLAGEALVERERAEPARVLIRRRGAERLGLVPPPDDGLVRASRDHSRRVQVIRVHVMQVHLQVARRRRARVLEHRHRRVAQVHRLVDGHQIGVVLPQQTTGLVVHEVRPARRHEGTALAHALLQGVVRYEVVLAPTVARPMRPRVVYQYDAAPSFVRLPALSCSWLLVTVPDGPGPCTCSRRLLVVATVFA